MNASSCRFKSCYPHQRLTKCEEPSLSITPKIMTDINENALHQATWRANFLDSINLPPVHRYDQNPLPCLSSEANAFGVQIDLCRKIPSGSCFPFPVLASFPPPSFLSYHEHVKKSSFRLNVIKLTENDKEAGVCLYVSERTPAITYTKMA